MYRHVRKYNSSGKDLLVNTAYRMPKQCQAVIPYKNMIVGTMWNQYGNKASALLGLELDTYSYAEILIGPLSHVFYCYVTPHFGYWSNQFPCSQLSAV